MCNKGLNTTDYTYDTIYITCAQYENLLISNVNFIQVHIATRFLSFPIVTITGARLGGKILLLPYNENESLYRIPAED